MLANFLTGREETLAVSSHNSEGGTARLQRRQTCSGPYLSDGLAKETSPPTPAVPSSSEDVVDNVRSVLKYATQEPDAGGADCGLNIRGVNADPKGF